MKGSAFMKIHEEVSTTATFGQHHWEKLTEKGAGIPEHQPCVYGGQQINLAELQPVNDDVYGDKTGAAVLVPDAETPDRTRCGYLTDG
ncbi:hypothetical protein FNAPI_11795 [Fusarium napiforme]|uniref:Uncharacterized protein n=1 Tax=Fusarium napiforme TaxID=42672 RepID=A0A8H5IKN7_9HYPO|nr:hypothetical protein FNAPI_11795 [Fusarium napiforme]